ncbi:MarR family transcriptional regulator [Sphingomonas ginkgonis]|nr:MarR family transcriptional regulator [Sphingomonas ginkgonis]
MTDVPIQRLRSGEPKIALSASDAREAARLLGLLTGQEEAAGRKTGVAPGSQREVAISRARREFSERKRRAEFFSAAMFGEPAWDILLALYVTEGTHGRHTMTSIRDLVGVPLTTALRWADYLERERLIARSQHPTDRRSMIIELTDKGRQTLDGYFSQ